jgi:fibrillarin-like pre-rRNA processing protein
VAVDVKPHPDFLGIYRIVVEDGARRLATRNLTPRKDVYGERLVRADGAEYRLWDPFRSKLAAAILKGLNIVPIKPGHQVLYLGAASGTTASHISDIVGETGHVYCIEFAARAMRELVNNVCVFRLNMTPILEDARTPQKYAVFAEQVDVIYCDVAQPEQAKILADNADFFLKEHGWTMLAVKSQSIDVTKKPAEIYKRETHNLESRGFTVKTTVELEPYDKAHAMIVSKI